MEGERDGVEGPLLCGRCGRIADRGEDDAPARVVAVEISLAGGENRSSVPVVLCRACDRHIRRRERELRGDPPDPTEGDPAEERAAALLAEPPLSSLLPVKGTGGRLWGSFRFACAACPATVREEESHARLIPGGRKGEAHGIDVAAACPACGCVTPYQVVFRADGLPVFHRDRPVRDPREKKTIPR
jgi:hypothetical protein